jgi:phytanoyl-CoA hydroxylase
MKTTFDADGFVILPGFLTADELAELSGQLDRHIREVLPTISGQRGGHYHDASRLETLKGFVFDLPANPKWQATADNLIGPAAFMYGLWRNKLPQIDNPTPAHQDNSFYNADPPIGVTIWLALDPVDRENGCLQYVKGSHKMGRRAHGRLSDGAALGCTDFGPEDESAAVEVPLQPGDAVAHHALILHWASRNRSQNRNRRALAMVFKGAGCK